MNNKNKRIVDCAILSALAIVLQLVSTLLKQFGVSLTLALVPVVIACVTLKWYGLIVSGALGEFLPARGILCAIMMLNVLAAVVIIGGNKKHVAKIYNVPD